MDLGDTEMLLSGVLTTLSFRRTLWASPSPLANANGKAIACKAECCPVWDSPLYAVNTIG